MESRHQNQKARRDSVRAGHTSRNDDTSTVLACNYCRSKKVKCIIETDSCQRCNRLKIQCSWPSGDQRRVPSSKSHIQELYQRIGYLESALEAATAAFSGESSRFESNSVQGQALWSTLPPSVSPSSMSSVWGESMISRLCGRQWRFNSDENGEYRFFGPTSSLHLTEGASTFIPRSCQWYAVNEDTTFGGRIDAGTQEHLLAIYFRNQPTAVQMIDQEEFLMGMRSGQSKYFSKALLCTVYACAARISIRPEVRALVIPSHDSLEDEQPFLMATASKLLDEELKKPQITTIQTLLLFSVVHCAFSNDSKGWLLVGNACRLAIDLGLHRNTEQLASINLAPRDINIRRVTYLACLVFDRLWALYLGRPFCLQGGVAELEKSSTPHYEMLWEMRIAESWARLLISVGHICEALNGEQCSDEAVKTLDIQLKDWYHHLQPDLCYFQGAHSSVILLHMQFYSTKIILHRAIAGFGSTLTQSTAQNNTSKQICIDNAKNIASALQDFRLTYGEATTMSGVALHVIATASTVLIACIAEKRSADVSDLCLALKTCIRSLSEMEKTYPVARRVRKIIRLIMGLCYLDVDNIDSQQDTSRITALTRDPSNALAIDPDYSTSTSSFQFQEGAMDLSSLSRWDFLCPGDSPQGLAQFDIMYNLDI